MSASAWPTVGTFGQPTAPETLTDAQAVEIAGFICGQEKIAGCYYRDEFNKPHGWVHGWEAQFLQALRRWVVARAALTTQPAGEGIADAEALERLALLPAPDRAACYAHFAALIAERDALRQWRFECCESLGLCCAAGAEWTVSEVFDCVRHEESKVITDRDRLAARCEGLEKALEEIRRWKMPPTDRFWDDGTPMSYAAAFGSNGERDYIRRVANAALSPPASDATEPLAAGVAG